MTTYLFHYQYDGRSYGFQIQATSLEEAKERIARLSNWPHYDGELIATIPVRSPWLVRWAYRLFGLRHD